MHTAKTYRCVKLIEAALTRPAHRPTIVRPHLADEYQDRYRHHPDPGSKDVRATFAGGKRGRMVQLTISGGATAFAALTQEQLAVLRETLDFASGRSLVDHPREGIEADQQVYVCPACQGIGVGQPAHVRDCERLTTCDKEGEGDGI